MIHGIINVYKEKGFTSHDVVAKLRGIVRQKKIGHTGTLDPDAIGVLPVCLGSGTKLCDLLTEKRKEYIAELLLGVTTDTQDMSGAILSEKQVIVSEEEVRETIHSFIGAFEQIPPMYSALKVNGKKLYELAREGKTVERKARPVIFYEIEVLELALPKVKIRVSCSKGTYIRTLCHDIGEKLGCGGAMASLIRTKSGQFDIQQALTLKQIEELVRNQTLMEYVIPVDTVFTKEQEVHVKEAFQKNIDNGNSFVETHIVETSLWENKQAVKVYNHQDKFYGIYEYCESENRFKPIKMFLERD
ncbi:MAG: tRNA pseudouridine(55) synthase TruB [Eubacteriales bacterium]